jgi:hypothetical protein
VSKFGEALKHKSVSMPVTPMGNSREKLPLIKEMGTDAQDLNEMDNGLIITSSYKINFIEK